MKCIQYNIWKSQNIYEIAQFLQSETPDFITLQEVHSTIPEARGSTQDAFTILCNILGLEGRFAPAMRLDDTVLYGNAVLSRWPILDMRSIFLNDSLMDVATVPDARMEPRVIICIKSLIGGQPLWIGSTHLTFDYDFVTSKLHVKQVQNIQQMLQTLDAPIILGGDFNTLPHSEIDEMLRKHLYNVTADVIGPTFAKHPFLKKDNMLAGLEYTIDHIYTSADIQVHSVKTIDIDPSDHLPIVMEFSLSDGIVTTE